MPELEDVVPKPEGDQTAKSEPTAEDLKKALGALEKERELRKEHEKSAKRLAAELADIKRQLSEGEMSEAEKVKREYEEVSKREKELSSLYERSKDELIKVRMDNAIYVAAASEGFVHPDMACKLVDRKKIYYNEDTERFEGIRDAIKACLEKYPDTLLKKSSSAGTPIRDAATARGQQQKATTKDPVDATAELLRHGGYY